MFKKIAEFVVKFRYYLFGLFMALVVASVFMIPHVGINYDFTKYLPNDSSTKVALEVMEDEFGASGTACIMVENITKEGATQLVKDILASDDVTGVASISFDAEKEACYKDNKALLSVFFEKSDYSPETKESIDSLKAFLDGYDFALGGSAVETVGSQEAIGSELMIILLIAVAIVILVLFLTSRSWLEPLVYLIVIGCSIVINMGTNLVMGEISCVTQSISSIMLIALVMDYCIVLCHRYREEMEKGVDAKTAMTKALAGSFLAIVASSLTVIAGLVALMFMDFTIGFDIGMVLAKGVFIGVLAVLFFMPSVIMMLAKGIEKTRHRSFMPKMDKIGTFAKKTRFVMPILFLCIVAVGLYFESNVNFTYVVESGSSAGVVATDQAKIEETFGKQNALVVMVGKNDDRDAGVAAERALVEYINNYFADADKFEQNYINSSTALATTDFYAQTMTKAQIMVMFGVTEADTEVVTKIDRLFTLLGKNPATDSVYLADVVTALHLERTVLPAAAEATVNNLYAQIAANNLYVALTAAQAQATYALSSQDAMNNVFKAILGVDTLQDTDTVQNYKILAYIYENDVEGRSQVEVISDAYNTAAFSKLTAQAICSEYGLTQAQVGAMFTYYGQDASSASSTIYNLQFVEYAHNNQEIRTQIGVFKQATIDGYYATLSSAEQMLVSENCDRMLFNMNLDVADEKALDFIRDLQDYLNENFESAYIVSNSENVISTMEVFSTDKLKTDLITILLIFLIVLLTFRSASIPVILVLAIQGAIWINLGLSSIMGDSVYFICYLLAMAIQMGATIDYAILLTDRYLTARRKQNKFEAIKTAIGNSFTTIITSGTILVLAAFTISWVSTIPLLRSIGNLIGRGALLSVLTILFVLPQCLLIFDKLIEKTTLKAKFVPLVSAPTVASSEVAQLESGDAIALVGDSTPTAEEKTNKTDKVEVEAETKKGTDKTADVKPVKTSTSKGGAVKTSAKAETKKVAARTNSKAATTKAESETSASKAESKTTSKKSANSKTASKTKDKK